MFIVTAILWSWTSDRHTAATFGTLINGLVKQGSKQSFQRAWRLWSEMLELRVRPDRPITGAMVEGAVKHFNLDLALQLRADLLRLGCDAVSLATLPPPTPTCTSTDAAPGGGE